jgi:hypothetical protein
MAVTSANTTGDPAARTLDEALAMLGESVDVYLDGGPAGQGQPSTIVDCTGEEPVTLRVGAVSQDELDEALVPEPVLEAPRPEAAPALEGDPARTYEQVADEPVAEEPVVDKQVTDEPVVDEPVADPAQRPSGPSSTQ